MFFKTPRSPDLEMAVTGGTGRHIWLAGGLSPVGEALTDVAIFDPSRW